MAEQVDFSDSGLKFPDETGDVAAYSGARYCNQCPFGCTWCWACKIGCQNDCVSDERCN